nr:PREDICTED: circadian clock-controlled protein-like [Bemisia tabaci]XP_018897042.1 PREDICTED: circadian clock-controlled protein-like [Bemisia tabaci]
MKNGRTILLGGIVAAISFITIQAAIPEYIKLCRKADPLVAKCINNSIEALRQKLAVGIDELDVPPIEPLVIKQIKLKRGPRGARIDAVMSNIKVWGCSDFRILELETDLVKNIYDFKLHLPHLNFLGKYSMDMNILFFRINGTGDMYGNFTDYRAVVRMTGSKVTRDGNVYLKMDKMKMKLEFGGAKIKLTNLFNGDPILGATANQVLNDNSRLFLEEIRPALEGALSDLFTDISNKITLRFTYDELFL